MAEKDLKRQQMEYIAVGALVLIALFVGMSKLKKEDKDDEVFSRTEFNQRWKEVDILEQNVPGKEKAIAFSLDAETTPFRGPLESKEKAIAEEAITLPVMIFQGMVWNSLRPQAIIDNTVYDIGDTIKIGTTGKDKQGAKIKDITKEGILIIYSNKEFLVRPKIKTKEGGMK